MSESTRNINWLVNWPKKYWIVVVSIFLGIFVIAPFIAPVFMEVGWEYPGRIIYGIYRYFCHQLPQRSFFLFGPQATYSLSQIQAVLQNTNDPAILRQFIGNGQMGWKVAWSDRMVSMYTSLWLFGMIWGVFRKRIKPLPWWAFVLFILPLAVDGTTHLISDLWGIGNGFRDSNAWLIFLTQNRLAQSFYSGDALGSFNSWMRLISGALFGLSFVWCLFPYIDEDL
jgi:uncharacterized membrane protein